MANACAHVRGGGGGGASANMPQTVRADAGTDGVQAAGAVGKCMVLAASASAVIAAAAAGPCAHWVPGVHPSLHPAPATASAK